MSQLRPANALYSFGERLGIVFVVESASISAAAVTILLVYIGHRYLKYTRAKRKSLECSKLGRSSTSGSSSVHYYFLNLMVSELVQAIGGIMSIKWVVDAAVVEGPLCTAQGIVKHIGEVSVSLASLTIAIHTFCVLVFRWQSHPTTALVVIAMTWVVIALAVGLTIATHKRQNYYGDTGYWCWITTDFFAERLGLEYVWIWMSALLNIIIYGFLALIFRGIIIIDNGKIHIQKWTYPVKNHLEADPDSDEERKESNAIAAQMLFYPAVYLITVSPMAVVRLRAFSGKDSPFSSFFASILFSLSGVLNVILFVLTRPNLLHEDEDSMHDTHATPMHPNDSLGYRCKSCGSRVVEKLSDSTPQSLSDKDTAQSPDDSHKPKADYSMGRLPDNDLDIQRTNDTELLPVHNAQAVTPPFTIVISSH